MKCIFVSFFYTLPFTFRTIVVLFWWRLRIILAMWCKLHMIRRSFAKVEFNPTKLFIFFTESLFSFLSHSLFLFITKSFSFHYLSHLFARLPSHPLDPWCAVVMNMNANILVYHSNFTLLIPLFLSHHPLFSAPFFHFLTSSSSSIESHLSSPLLITPQAFSLFLSFSFPYPHLHTQCVCYIFIVC